MAEQVIEIRGFEELTQSLGRLGRMDERVFWPLHDAMSQRHAIQPRAFKEWDHESIYGSHRKMS